MSSETVVTICEKFIRNQCTGCETNFHHHLPFNWQVTDNGSLYDIAVCFETLRAQISTRSTSMPQRNGFTTATTVTSARRLSTRSYGADVNAATNAEEEAVHQKFVTQWRWFCLADGKWLQFGDPPFVKPAQCVLEAKFVAGQQIYRFESDFDGECAIDLRPDRFKMYRLVQGSAAAAVTKVRRRPLFVCGANMLPWPNPTIAKNPFAASAPNEWSPLDTTQDYELVALDPTSMHFHMVASSFYESMSLSRHKIVDIFRLQNIFLWHKYESKRQQMTLKQQGRPLRADSAKPMERLLFHGTMSETAVKAICRQNFDWRLNGANDVLYGRGAYFALNASFSDRYANAQKKRLNWMFLARVLVGRTAVGHRNMVRPPPLDPARPDGDLYDCCVNAHETIFVIFDSDQMYPEFVISYESKTA